MSAVNPDEIYSKRNEQVYRTDTNTEIGNCHKKDEEFILRSPNGAPWVVGVDNSGNLTVSGEAWAASNEVLLWLSM